MAEYKGQNTSSEMTIYIKTKDLISYTFNIKDGENINGKINIKS